MKLPASFTQKLGPLPAWAWGLGLAATIIGVIAVRRSEAAEVGVIDGAGIDDGTPPPEDDSDLADDEFAVAPVQPGVGYLPPPAPIVPPVVEPAPLPPAPLRPTSNAQWRTMANDYLAGERGFPPGAVYNAILDFLAGREITVDYNRYVQEALRQLGPPPQGAPRIRVKRPASPPPKPKTPPKPPPKAPPADQVRTVRPGDTLDAMARLVYGKNSEAAERQVAAHNRLRRNGKNWSPWRVGQRVRFPHRSKIRF